VHGMADTLITPINDSLVDLDVLVAIEQSAPRWFGVRLRRDEKSMVALPTGSWFGTDWNRSSQAISVRSLRSWTLFKGQWVFALRAVCWSGPYIASSSPPG